MKTIVVLWNAMRYSASVSCNLAGAPLAFIAYVTVCRQVNVICLSQVTSSIVFIPVSLTLILHRSTSHMTHGELLANRNGFRFEAIEFGNECGQLACEDNDNDALMELFLIRDNLRSYNLPNLTLQVQDGFDMLLLLQEIPDLAQDTHYYRTCLPKDSCLNLTMFVPETYTM